MSANLIIGGLRNSVFASLMNIKMDSKAHVVVSFGFPEGSKITLCTQDRMWSHCSSIDRALRNVGVNTSAMTIYVFGPYMNGKEVMKELRNNLAFHKTTIGKSTDKIEFAGATQDEVESALASIRTAVLDMPNIRQDIVSSIKIADNDNRKAATPIVHTNNSDTQVRLMREFAYPDPVVTLPEISIRDLVRQRVEDFVLLTAEENTTPTGDDYKFVWENLWIAFDRHYAGKHGSIRRDHDKLANKGTKVSILELAEQRGLMNEVYAVACNLLFKEPEMPRKQFAANVNVEMVKTITISGPETYYDPKSGNMVVETPATDGRQWTSTTMPEVKTIFDTFDDKVFTEVSEKEEPVSAGTTDN